MGPRFHRDFPLRNLQLELSNGSIIHWWTFTFCELARSTMLLMGKNPLFLLVNVYILPTGKFHLISNGKKSTYISTGPLIHPAAFANFFSQLRGDPLSGPPVGSAAEALQGLACRNHGKGRVKPGETRWNQVKPGETRWNQVKPGETRWN